MLEVYRNSDAGLVSMRQSLLEDAGIQTFVRNLITQQTLVGGLATAFFPIPQFWPALCVVDDEDYPEAMALLGDYSDATEAEWVCPRCKESNPGNFAICWSCRSGPERENHS